MTQRPARRRLVAATGVAALAASLGAAGPATAVDAPEQRELYVNPDSSTIEAAAGLTGRDRANALYLGSFPGATWIEHGTAAEAAAQADEVLDAAEAADQVPVLVIYNIPFRDCAQYSAGGATSLEEYNAWIDGIAEGVGDREAIFVVEPDGLGIIPWHGGDGDWCEPVISEDEAEQAEFEAEAANERYAMLNHAVDALGANENAAVYLDATHPGWLNVGEASARLIRAGVEDATGFFLNASNYTYTENNVQFGTWISSCIALTVASEEAVDCPNQYWNGGPAFPDWGNGVALTQFGVWSDTTDQADLSTASINARYATMLADAGVEPTASFVVDTSRNGQGPWNPEGVEYDPVEDWCNPPDRGLGQRPTLDTGHDLVDGFLWIKVPGESDGLCLRGTEGPEDPVRGVVDPPAGGWFPMQAAELIAFAVPDAFYDVPLHHPFYADITWLAGTGVTTGYDDDSYRPATAVNRDAMAAFLFRMAAPEDWTPPDEPTFSDVGLSHPFYTEIEWLAAQEITTGFADGTYRPSHPVSREAMAAFLYRFDGGALETGVPFTDVTASSPFYVEIAWLYHSGITTGYGDNTFRPSAPINRDAMAAFLHRLEGATKK